MNTFHIIAIQGPVVLMLALQSYLLFRSVGIYEFKLISLAWLLNFSYLILSLSLHRFASPELTDMAITGCDLLSTFLFFLAVKDAFKTGRLSFVRNLHPYLLLGFLVVAGLVKSLPVHAARDTVPFIVVRAIPVAIFDLGVLALLAAYFKQLTKKYKLSNLLPVGTMIYAGIQLLGILQEESYIKSVYVNVETIGFCLGLLAKCIIVGSLLQLFPTLQDYNNKKTMAAKLDDILGRTFHEITYPLQAMESYLAKLLPSEDEKPITNRNEIYEQVRRVDSSYNHLLAIMSASIKLYESDSSLSYDNQSVKIPEVRVETASVNTLIQIALLKIKPITAEKVEFLISYGGNCFINCHSYQIIQVFLNLFKNSVEAFPEGKGKISIRTRVHKIAPGEKRVEVSVEDDGPGIPFTIQEEAFRQGFSTKSQKQKRGFGLAIVKDTVETHNGTICLDTAVTKDSLGGATFAISFPQAGSHAKSNADG